jgi:hypothetical protein
MEMEKKLKVVVAMAMVVGKRETGEERGAQQRRQRGRGKKGNMRDCGGRREEYGKVG